MLGGCVALTDALIASIALKPENVEFIRPAFCRQTCPATLQKNSLLTPWRKYSLHSNAEVYGQVWLPVGMRQATP